MHREKNKASTDSQRGQLQRLRYVVVFALDCKAPARVGFRGSQRAESAQMPDRYNLKRHSIVKLKNPEPLGGIFLGLISLASTEDQRRPRREEGVGMKRVLNRG
jgi:hypothetical protein